MDTTGPGSRMEAVPPAFIPLSPAASQSSASLALTAPPSIPLQPAVSNSAASLGFMAGATPSAYLGSALTIQPYTAAELHPHTFPPSLFDAVPMLAAVTYVVVRENFRYCRTLHDAPTGERE
jgi:hypothetical protein